MPIRVDRDAPTVFLQRAAWERAGLARSQVDDALGLTPEEFRVEGALVAIGPLYGEGQLERLVTLLEGAGLAYFDDFFELSGNWPAWMVLHVRAE
jgi:hypothetical protein